MLKLGDVILANVQFVNSFEVKIRPAVVLFEEFGNIIIAAITSNTNMHGILLTQKDGAIKNSIIKTNYIFTISAEMVKKKLFSLSEHKTEELRNTIASKLHA